MSKTNDIKGIEKIATTLGRETNFSGVMQFSTSLKIDGKFQGKIVSPGFLYVEEGAVINADIDVGSVIIGGYVKGNVIAKQNLELLPTGQLFGDIKTSKLKIADGVIFEGKCEMIKNDEGIDIFSARVDDIKKKVKSV
jgi:cytoskeletal protein CcmA (bactofilin family)